MEQEKSNTNSPKESNVSKKYSKTSVLSKTISKTSLIHKVGFHFCTLQRQEVSCWNLTFRWNLTSLALESENLLQTSRSTKEPSGVSREPDSDSRQLDTAVTSVRDTGSTIRETGSSVRGTTGRVSRQESTISGRNTAPTRDSKGPFENFHSKYEYLAIFQTTKS